MTRSKPRYQPGDRISGRYQVHKALMGGMGEIYLCLDLERNYPYALKTFQQRYQSTALRKAFEQEVATWVALEKHPNIVRCFYMDIIDNQPFMVLEWIAGEEGKGADLRGWLRHGPLDLKTALEITIDVVRGLIHGQEKQPGLVHRDLKPENILVAQGGLAKITDFGLAQIVQSAGLEIEGKADGRQSMVGKGGIAGTPAYMAPEQWRGETLDERTDIYAVGCILYEMLTGRVPFWVDFTPATPHRFQQWLSVMQSSHEVTPPPDLTGRQLKNIGGVIRGCLAKVTAKRPTNLVELMSQLVMLYQQQFDQSPPIRPVTGKFTAADYYNRGNTYKALNKLQEAIADYGSAIELDSDYSYAYNNRGNTFLSLGQQNEAFADFNEAIRCDDRNVPAYLNRALVYGNLGLPEKVLEDCYKVLNIDPQNAKAYYNCGVINLNRGEYEIALSNFQKAVELQPEFPEAQHNLDVCQQLMTLDREQNVPSHSLEAKEHYNQALDYVDEANWRDALTSLTAAIRLDPDFIEAYNNRGLTYLQLAQPENALVDFNEAIRLNPAYAKAYFNRGVAYEKLQRISDALEDYRYAGQLDPNDAEAPLNMGVCLANDGLLQEALPYFQKAAQLGDKRGADYVFSVERMLGEKQRPGCLGQLLNSRKE